MRSDIEYIDQCITTLTQYHKIQDHNNNIILNITDEKTRITLIPRNVSDLMRSVCDGALAYGVNISGSETRDFLVREYGFDMTKIQKSDNTKI
jgi:hypothetical protein